MSSVHLDVGGHILSVTGELTFNTVTQVWEESFPLLDGNTQMEIDLSGVTRGDSAALALLIEWFRYAKNHSKTVLFKNLPMQLMNMAKMSRLDTVLAFNDQ